MTNNMKVLKMALLNSNISNLKEMAADLGMSYNTLKSKIREQGSLTILDAYVLHQKYGIICNVIKGELVLKYEGGAK
jgi:AraC-like DNA-binding protein